MRKILLGVLLVPLAVAAACVGSDPDQIVPPAATGTSSGNASSSSSTSSGSASSSGAGTSSSSSGQVTPACEKVVVSTFAGSDATGASDDAGTLATFNKPVGLAVDPGTGTLYVADSFNNSVRTIEKTGAVHTFATNLGNANRVAFSAANGVYVAAISASQIFHIKKPAAPTSVILPSAITVGEHNGDVYGASSTDCAIFSIPSSGDPTVFAGHEGTSSCGSKEGTKDGGATFSQNIVDFTFDDTTMYVAENSPNYRGIRVIAGLVRSLTKGDAFEDIGGVTYDTDSQHQRLYVADKTQIKVVNIATGDVTKLIGGPGSKDGSGCDARFGALKGIAYYQGSLFVVDGDRIRKIELNN